MIESKLFINSINTAVEEEDGSVDDLEDSKSRMAEEMSVMRFEASSEISLCTCVKVVNVVVQERIDSDVLSSLSIIPLKLDSN